MKISLIIPTRDRVSYLKRCIKSIENQNVPPYELIIILHKEDQISKEFLNNYSTKLNIKFFETDGGSSKARNLAIYHSYGDILAFIEDDVILEENYIKNIIKTFKNNEINVLTGYTFDIGVLTTPWYINKSEFEYIHNHKDNEFYKMMIEEISKRSDGKISLDSKFINGFNFKLYRSLRYLRDFFKSVILQEWPVKGKILPSGYRSAFPDIGQINGLKKLEWFCGGNFAIKKDIISKYQFNEKMELLPYALCEDLELSARIGKEYEIFISSEVVLFHLSSPSGVKINQRERFKSMLVNFYRVASLRGNKLAYWWSVTGLMITRLFKLPFSYNEAISEIKGIIDGVKYLRNNDL